MTISEQRKKRVIYLYYNQGKTTREIAKIERMSISDISIILKEEETRRQKSKDQQQQEDLSAQAYELFAQEKTLLQVAISLKIRQSVATKLYREYWKLKRLHKLNLIYKETNGKLGPFLKLYRLIKEKSMSIEQVANVVEIAIYKLPYMESLYKQVNDEVDKLQYAKQVLVNDIQALKYKISLLNKTPFTSEQDCKKTEQRVKNLLIKRIC